LSDIVKAKEVLVFSRTTNNMVSTILQWRLLHPRGIFIQAYLKKDSKGRYWCKVIYSKRENYVRIDRGGLTCDDRKLSKVKNDKVF
jgi:hypothetical protein